MRFCDLIDLESVKFTIFMRNLVFDLAKGKLEADDVAGFCVNLENALSEKPPDSHEDTFEDLLKSSPTVENLDALLRFVRPSGSSEILGSHVKFAREFKATRVVSVRDFMNHNVKSAGGDPILTDLSRPRTDRVLLERAKKFESDDYKANLKVGSKTGPGRVWISKLKHFSNRNIDDVHEMRNELGLDYYSQINTEEGLIMLVFSSNEIPELRSPIAFDGIGRGIKWVYWSHGKKGEWGRTLNLETLEFGAPEALSGPISVNRDFNIKVLGQLTDDKPQTDLASLRSKAAKQFHYYNRHDTGHCQLCAVIT